MSVVNGAVVEVEGGMLSKTSAGPSPGPQLATSHTLSIVSPTNAGLRPHIIRPLAAKSVIGFTMS